MLKDHFHVPKIKVKQQHPLNIGDWGRGERERERERNRKTERERNRKTEIERQK